MSDMIDFLAFAASLMLALCLPMQASAETGISNEDTIVAQATDGFLKSTKGRYFDKACNEQVDYSAKVVDLNGDGQPEVITNQQSICLAGMAGNLVDLYIKDKHGQWQSQFGFGGAAELLKTRHLGYPDIEISGPGMCFPVWRWNGTKYRIYKKCP